MNPVGFFKSLKEDIDGIMERDPAARSRLEVFLTYPGFHALLAYRLANAAWRHRLRMIGRLISYVARAVTGIEIHPGARIGRRLFIDHGMGVVIGETAEIGDDVTLYHGVTLGGLAPSVDSARQKHQKRHPTLADRVIVGAGAQVLGPFLVGEGARIGANAVVVSEVPAHTTAVGIPARVVLPRRQSDDRFCAYGLPTSGELPDPVARAVGGLLDQLQLVTARLEALERHQQEDEALADAGLLAAAAVEAKGESHHASSPLASSPLRHGLGDDSSSAAN